MKKLKHSFTQCNKDEIFEFYIEHGADLEIRDVDGKIVHDYEREAELCSEEW